MIILEKCGHILVIRSFKQGLCRNNNDYYLYLTDGILINTGMPRDGKELEEQVQAYKVRLIVNTHYHLAAVGNNARLQRRFSVPIRAHKRIVYQLRYPRQTLLERLYWGSILPCKAAGIPSTVHMEPRRYRVIETPGKAAGHICLFDPGERWLFTGQLLAPRQVEDPDQLVRDLKKILALKPHKVFCSHNGVIEDGYGAIEDCLKAIAGSSVKV